MEMDRSRTEKELVERPIYKSLAEFSRRYVTRRIYYSAYASVMPEREKVSAELRAKIEEYDQKEDKFNLSTEIVSPMLYCRKVRSRRRATNSIWEERAWESTLNQINAMDINGRDSNEIHRHQKCIMDFFKALCIDQDIFKINRHYVMTKSFSILCEDILNCRGSFTEEIIGHQFENVPFRKICSIYSQIVRAIEDAPVEKINGESKKKTQIDALKKFLGEFYDHDIGASNFKNDNAIVDVILDAVWYHANKVHWDSLNNPAATIYDDWKWCDVIEGVYDDLYSGRILNLSSKVGIASKEKSTLCDSIPPYCVLDRTNPKLIEIMEKNKRNPNIQEEVTTFYPAQFPRI